VVEGDGAALAATLATRLQARHRVHAAFGTATVELPDGTRLDVATARRESYARPAALPRVEPAELHEDLMRRDFTCNCLALDLSPGRFGELIDPCGGREDLRSARIRVLHDRSFVDDPTRIFRAVRFAIRLGFHPVPETRKLLVAAVGSGMVERLSAARLRREIAVSLTEADGPTVARALQERGVWERVDPALRVGALEKARLERLGRSPRMVKPEGKSGHFGWLDGLAVLAFDCTPGQRRRLVGRLRPDRRSGRLLVEAPSAARALLRRLGRARRPGPGTVWSACRRVPELAVRLAWVVTVERGIRSNLGHYLEEWMEASADIDGSDLVAAGIPPGPAIARGLRVALRAKLDGHAVGREAQMARALRAARRASS
jgi:tRNA nucleotidyltransferase (CCA-adding enzyme)